MTEKKSFEKITNDNSIVLISIPNCSYCVKAKEFLKKNKQKFKEVLYDKNLEEEFWKQYKKKYPYVPRVIIDKKFIGGFMELKEFDFKNVKTKEKVKINKETKKPDIKKNAETKKKVERKKRIDKKKSAKPTKEKELKS